MRLFAGFPLPPLTENRLSALRFRLAAPKDGLRWTAPEQWHVTLRFFGDLDPADLPTLQTALNRFQPPAPRLRMEALGHFAVKGILYAALEPTAELTAFHSAFLDQVTLGTPPSSSLPFHPHITLARSKGPAGLGTLRRLVTPAPPTFGSALEWSAGPVHLYESILGPGGAAYNTVGVQASPAAQT